MMRVDVSVESTLAPLDYDWLVKECKTALIEAAKSMNQDFNAATHTWDHRPTFGYWGPFMEGNELYIEAGPKTYTQLFDWVDTGTKPHAIVPKRKKQLAFQSKYRAKTQAYSMYSGPGGKSGHYVYRPRVSHPGFKGREFIALSAANHQPWWNTRVYLIMQKFGQEVGMARRIHKVYSRR